MTVRLAGASGGGVSFGVVPMRLGQHTAGNSDTESRAIYYEPMAREDRWRSPVAVSFPRLEADPQTAEVVWTDGECSVAATVAASDNHLVVREFVVTGQEGTVPAWARRLPGDDVVAQSMRRMGTEGVSAIAALLRDQDRLSRIYQHELERSKLSPEEESVREEALRKTMQRYGALIGRRRQEDVKREVEFARESLDDGVPRSEVAVRLQTTFFLSRRTAYRRIETAEEES